MKAMSRPIPTLAQWIGDGARGEGFEEWVRETIALEHAVPSADEAALVRIIKLLAVACLEASRIETEAHGRPVDRTFIMLARACGIAAMAPVLSVVDNALNPPLRRIVRELSEEFGHGAMCMAKSALALRAREKS